MANYVGGNKNVEDFISVTAAANLVAWTFVNINGAVPANAEKCTGGVVQTDVTNADYATLATGAGSMVKVLATGTVTAGNFVEILTSTFTTKDTTGVTGAGVQNATSTNVVVGKAITGGVVNDTVLVELLHAVNV